MEKLDHDSAGESVLTAEHHSAKPTKPATEGLRIPAQFCPEDVADPFDTVDWDSRTAAIKGEGGDVLFEQQDCEIPTTWSQLATNVVANKYFYGEVGTGERERGVRQLIHRVCRTIADWGTEDGYFASKADGERFYRDLAWICLHQHASFNSPVWFNVGLYHQYGIKGAMCNWHWDKKAGEAVQPENPYEFPQASACFIQSVQDNMEDIMELARSEAMLFKFGSGTGTDLSTLRSHREKLSGGGRPSGPLSFMRVYDQIAAVVKSGGKTRRAAKMQSIKDWHPDVLEFIECKNREEKKVRTLVEQGYDPQEAYDTVLFQNANLSVRLSDDFMRAVETDEAWTTHWVTDPSKAGPSYRAREVFTKMANSTWCCGDPGVQFDTTINRWHTCPNSGRINASNPCVTGDTLVATAEGLKTIESLVGLTPRVIGSDGSLHQTTQVVCTGIRQVYRLRLRSGHDLKLTGDHRVLTKDGRDVPARELVPGDEVRLGRISFGQESLAAEDAKALGKSLAEGEINVRCIPAAVQANAYCRHSGYGADVIEECECLLDLNADSAAAVVRGFYRQQESFRQMRGTGGANCPPGYIELHHPSVEVLRQLQLLLQGFGISSQVIEDKAQLIHRLWIASTHKDRFERLVEHEQAVIDKGFFSMFEQIKSIEPLGEEQVFDLTEPQTNHFVANGLVVHNCSEYMFVDDSACNLASINLMKFRLEDGSFDVERFLATCRLVFIAQEILVDHASYPTKRIAANSHRFRPLGLGYSNLGSLIMTSGLAYDSDEARGLCAAITALLHGAACNTSAELAAAVGTFDDYEKNRDSMMHVMEMHWEKVDEIKSCPAYLQQAARDLWDKVVAHGKRHGFRNAQATVLAPTGTISFMMDCDTTGIEPDIALVKYKQLAGGGMLKMVNQKAPLALKTLGYDDAEIEAIIAYIDKHDTIEGAPDFLPEHLPVFDCAFPPRNGKRSIAWRAHVRMMAAAQPFISGAISKTVNMPKESTPDDVADAFMEGWRLGLKALAIYRDGSKEVQPLSTKTKSDKAAEKLVAAPRRERLPDTRQSITHKFNVSGHEGYITVGLYPDGRPGELFITMAKEGSTIGGLMDCFGTAVSMSLQYGVPLDVYVNKFSHTRFEPMGFTKNPDIKIAKSLVDYIFRWLGNTFLPGFREANKAIPSPADASHPADTGDPEPELLPAATMAGGPNAAHGSAKTSGGSNGAGPNGRTAAPNSSAPNGNGRTAGNGHTGSAGVSPASSESGRDARAPSGRAATKYVLLGVGNGPTVVKAAMKTSERMTVGASARAPSPSSPSEQYASFQTDAPTCDNCGAITVRSGNCYLCYNCGSSMGCS